MPFTNLPALPLANNLCLPVQLTSTSNRLCSLQKKQPLAVLAAFLPYTVTLKFIHENF